ncbi:hypothetical protein [Streptomyces sp. WAC06614]|uniref:hypothetical protein n=1 Tax=Streptomyces sp. WAC06614 TaxID=2487416 RepID=UPI0021AF7FD7|nr:hypothetical protein [Streptomyces sp. WAC06614]
MRCGYAWEQAYEIEHHTDAKGEPFIIYTAGGERVPSPLSNPTCHNCDGHVVRIMREGKVGSVLGMLDQLYHDRRIAPGIAGPVPATHDHDHASGTRRRAGQHTGRRLPQTGPHDAPGPVSVGSAEPAGERSGGLLARLRRMLGRS